MRSGPLLTEGTQINNDNDNNNNDSDTIIESLFAICNKSKIVQYSFENCFKDTHTLSHPPLFVHFVCLVFLSTLYVEHGA